MRECVIPGVGCIFCSQLLKHAQLVARRRRLAIGQVVQYKGHEVTHNYRARSDYLCGSGFASCSVLVSSVDIIWPCRSSGGLPGLARSVSMEHVDASGIIGPSLHELVPGSRGQDPSLGMRLLVV